MEKNKVLEKLLENKKQHLLKRVNLSFKEDGERILGELTKAHMMFDAFPYYYTSTMYYEMGDYYLPLLKEKLKDLVNEFYNQEIFYEQGVDGIEARMQEAIDAYNDNIDEAESIEDSIQEAAKELGIDPYDIEGFRDIQNSTHFLRDGLEQANRDRDWETLYIVWVYT